MSCDCAKPDEQLSGGIRERQISGCNEPELFEKEDR